MLMPGALGCSEFHSVGGLLFRMDTFHVCINVETKRIGAGKGISKLKYI